MPKRLKLYDVPRGSRIKIIQDREHPPHHRNFDDEEELEFSHIDGMYSLCFDDDNNPVHLAAWAEVEVIREGPKK